MGLAVEKSRTMVSAMILGRRITAQDVAWLRREVFAEGEVTREDAEELFAVARARMDNAPEWMELFVELITDHVVWQSRPTGIVTASPEATFTTVKGSVRLPAATASSSKR